MVKIEIELPEKMKTPLEEVVISLKEANQGKEITKEQILSEVCKQYIAQEYSKCLLKSD